MQHGSTTAPETAPGGPQAAPERTLDVAALERIRAYVDTAGGPAGAGLVSSAISTPTVPDDLSTVVRGMLAFPTSDLVSAAAGMWPEPDRRQSSLRWSRTDNRSTSVEHWSHQEGGWPRVEIAPGLVRFARTDQNRAERARAAAADRHERMGQQEYEVDAEGNVVRIPTVAARRGGITSWSAKSRARMIAQVSSLDLAPVLDQGMPGMLTLTLPGDWLAVAPSAAAAADVFQRFVKAYEKKWGKLRCLWKREFQRRGAPHWHLWMVPPAGAEFRRWVRYAWATAMRVQRPAEAHDELPDVKTGRRGCSCSEWCRSVNAGTGLDFAEGLRASDPRRLAVYFLKESGIGEGKAYQNDAPLEWQTEQWSVATREPLPESVGRFWGRRGLELAVVSVDVDPADQYAVWRVMRKVRESTAGTRKVRVSRMNAKTGEVGKFRSVNRRVRVTSAAGWVSVNDGAAFGEALGRYATQLITERRARAAVERDRLDRQSAPMPDPESAWWSGANR